MKITLRIMRILFSAVSVAAMAVLSVMLFYSGILAALDACGFIDLDDEPSYAETKSEPMQYSVFKEPETIRIGYTLIDISEPDIRYEKEYRVRYHGKIRTQRRQVRRQVQKAERVELSVG